LTFDLGKRAPSYNHTYISIDDGNIYHAATDLRRTFEKDSSALRDLQVLSFAKDEIVRIEAVSGDTSIVLTKDMAAVDPEQAATTQSVTWKSGSGDVWETEVIDELLGRLDDLECTQFIDSSFSQDSEALLSLTLVGTEEY
jgi:hypothetical protein